MKTDARKLTTEQQALLRQQAIRLRWEKNMTFREIGQILNIHPDTAGRWFKRYQTEGQAVLTIKKRGPKNKVGRLNAIQQQKVIEAIRDHMPDHYNLGFSLWTRRAVAALIYQFWRIDIPVRTLGDYLKRWGFTPQKPLKKAWEQNPAHVQTWLNEEYPQIQERAKKEQAQIYWGDETGIRNTEQHGRCYAPRGKTPTQPIPVRWHTLNMISAISNQGTVRFMLYESNMTADTLLKFIRALMTSRPGKSFLILDNLRVHHAKKVKDWLEQPSVKRRLEVFYLPAYSPELNPDEYLNCDVKGMIHSRPAMRSVEEIKKRTRSCMRKLQRQPKRVISYFNSRFIKYAA
ncbi:IS630 family transposase [Photorhabdus tasmaniensis]|uniref:IS630 family transposase n=2 Tax=Photorhabdus TaxID=29487 RepID=A0ABX0GI93_9GAMM|nr:IS630 family transposase [Photorhabdus tasmaniensis]NHB88531.1 IS630 family transposase [Photorhabdus tasmaniensis]